MVQTQPQSHLPHQGPRDYHGNKRAWLENPYLLSAARSMAVLVPSSHIHHPFCLLLTHTCAIILSLSALSRLYRTVALRLEEGQNMPFDLKERWDAYTGVWEGVRFGLWHLLQALLSGRWDGFRDFAFANFYTDVGPHFARFEEEQTPVPRLIGSANGIILELGPGSGNQIPRFRSSAISKIYAVEPNAQFILILVQRAKDHGLDEKYIVINAALEDEEILATHRIVDGGIDTVVCMQVLCSVPDVDAAAKRIWMLLKPGGQLVYWEHQGSSDGVTRFVQRMWNLIRKPLMGGCHLDRDIEDAIMSTGAWEIVEMGRDGDDGYDLMPRCWGRLRKPVE